jgi:hypothetical protein
MNQQFDRGDARSVGLDGWTPRRGLWSSRRAVIGRYCSDLSRRPPAGNPCLSLTSRVVSPKATETPFTSRTRPNSGGLGRRSVMTILQKPRHSGDGQPARAWHRFGRGDQAVRYTEAWDHETFAEEQARWERSDPEYARICEQVRQAREKGGEASPRADEVKAQWDARVATQRQANDDAQRAHHTWKADRPTGRRPVTSRTSSHQRKSRFYKEDSEAALCDPRSRRPPPRAHHVRDRVQ